MRKLIVISGVPIDDLNTAETLDRLEEFVRVGRDTGKTHQVATVNADFVVKAMADPELRFLLQEADLLMPDGMPLVWGAKLLGHPLEERVTGSDMVPMLAQRAAEKGFSLYLLGAAPGIAQHAADVLQEQLPNLKIAGVYSPPYSPILEMDPTIAEKINAADPDILLVAFGNPKQEKWIGMYRNQLKAPVMIGVGATLDFIAGYQARAPLWMQKSGLEWLYRLSREPKRLWRRYVVDLFYFAYFFVRQWWAMQRGQTPEPALPHGDSIILENDVAVLDLQGKITIQNHESVHANGRNALAEVSTLIVNLADVTFLDSTAIGTLVALAREAQAQDGTLILAAVPPSVLKILAMLKLDSFFTMQPSVSAALASLTKPQAAQPTPRADAKNTAVAEQLAAPVATPVADTSWSVLPVPRRLDAMTADDLTAQCEQRLQQNPFLILDFSATVFLASAGLAALNRIQQQAQAANGRLHLAHCAEDVLRVIQIVRFDKLLNIYPTVQDAMHPLATAPEA